MLPAELSRFQPLLERMMQEHRPPLWRRLGDRRLPHPLPAGLSWLWVGRADLVARCSVRLGQPEHLLGDEGQHQLRRDRCDSREHHLAQQSLDVEFFE